MTLISIHCYFQANSFVSLALQRKISTANDDDVISTPTANTRISLSEPPTDDDIKLKNLTNTIPTESETSAISNLIPKLVNEASRSFDTSTDENK